MIINPLLMLKNYHALALALLNKPWVLWTSIRINVQINKMSFKSTDDLSQNNGHDAQA